MGYLKGPMKAVAPVREPLMSAHMIPLLTGLAQRGTIKVFLVPSTSSLTQSHSSADIHI